MCIDMCMDMCTDSLRYYVQWPEGSCLGMFIDMCVDMFALLVRIGDDGQSPHQDGRAASCGHDGATTISVDLPNYRHFSFQCFTDYRHRTF